MVYLALNSKATPLLEAVEQGNYAVVKLLLEHGADPNAKNQVGFTPVSRAKDLGCASIVKALEKKSRTRR
jgi:ankyrin repeat protein